MPEKSFANASRLLQHGISNDEANIDKIGKNYNEHIYRNIWLSDECS